MIHDRIFIFEYPGQKSMIQSIAFVFQVEIFLRFYQIVFQN